MMAIPDGWVDVTEDMGDDMPPTLARNDGVGVLQFSVGRHVRGPHPNITRDTLRAMLHEFAASRGVEDAKLRDEDGAVPCVSADFHLHGRLVRTWYLSDGKDLAKVTYVTARPDHKNAKRELKQASELVSTITFA